MTGQFEDIVEKILAHYGSLVEKCGDCIESMLPKTVAQMLDVPEFVHICFSREKAHENAVQCTHDSPVFERLGDLFTQKGRFAHIALKPYSIRQEKLSETLSDKIPLNNAVLQHTRTEEKIISYLMLYFKYKAISDETQEGMVNILINELNLSTSLLKNRNTDILNDIDVNKFEEQSNEVERKPLSLILQAACKSAEKEIRAVLADFIKSLNRRLDRNITRVHDYYNAMIAEVEHGIDKKGPEGADMKKEKDRIKAIEAELTWKIQDLISKFALNIKTEPISAIRMEVLTHVFWIDIKRRKRLRKFPATYNPILKHIDPLPCESCFFHDRSYYICDDNLHIVCNHCFRECAVCRKGYCPVCYPSKCPKCKK